MNTVPRWFRRELDIIDSAIYPVFDPESQTWDFHKVCTFETLKKCWKEDRIVGNYPRLDHKTLAELRYRKWLGRKFEIDKHPLKYHKWLKAQEKEARAKKARVGQEMRAAGYRKAHELATKKYFHF